MNTIFLVLQKPKYKDSAWIIEDAFINENDANYYAQKREEVCIEDGYGYKFRVIGLDIRESLNKDIFNNKFPACEVMIDI